MASAHDAQWAGVDGWEALMRPKPPMARGRCALANVSTGSESVCRSCVVIMQNLIAMMTVMTTVVLMIMEGFLVLAS